jgi:ketosteroid isomerase-like protein
MGELAQLVRQGYEAWNRGDRSWVLEHMSAEVEWITPPEDPEPGHYRGYEGVERFWEQWRAAVGQLRFEIEELIEAGEQVVVVARRQGRGKQSGLEVSDRVAQVFSFEDGVCVRVEEFYDRAKALQAAGVTAQTGAP